jgi:hypothetical protein
VFCSAHLAGDSSGNSLRISENPLTRCEWVFFFWEQKGGKMADQSKPGLLSLDGWAVAVALLLAALVRLGVLKHVAW